MSVLDEVLGAVEGIVKDYTTWNVGVSANPKEREKNFESATGWHQWNARSEVAARAIAQYLADRGMNNCGGEELLPTYVYIFKQ